MLLFGMASAWSFPNNYLYGQNIIVPSWMYVGTDGFSAPAYGALVILNGISSASTLNVIAYGAGGVSSGEVPIFPIWQQGNTLAIFLLNQTTSGNIWNNATVFFNPINGTSLQNIGFYPRNSTFNPSYRNQSFKIIPSMLTNGISTQSAFPPLSTCGSDLPPWPFFFSSPIFSNTVKLYTNWSLNCNFPAFVVLANRTLNSQFFNITWNPSGAVGGVGGSTFNFSAVNNRYRMSSLGFAIFHAPNFVSNDPIVSSDANAIFGGRTDGVGMEAYFGGAGTAQIAGEGMYRLCQAFSGCYMFNFTSRNSTEVNANNRPNTFILSMATATPTSFYIVPPFTTNVIVSNFISTNPTPSSGGNTPINGIPYFWFTPIVGIHWNYTFTSLATGTAMTTNAIHYTFNNLAYAVVKLPHYITPYMQTNCQDLQVEVNVTPSFFDSVPFAIASCNPSNITLVVSNTSKLGFSGYNSIRVYSDYVGGLIASGQSNSILFNTWQFESGNFFTLTPSTSTPLSFIVNTTTPLLGNSILGLSGMSCSFSSVSYKEYDQDDAISYNLNGCGGGTNIFPDYTGHHAQGFLFAVDQFGATGTTASTYLRGNFTASATARAGALNTTSSAFQTVSSITGLKIFVNLTAPNAATAQLVSTHCPSATCLILALRSNPFNATNGTVPIFPSNYTTIPQTSNGILYNNTTTINITNASVANDVIVLGDSGVAIPFGTALVLQIILFIFSLALYEKGGHIPSIMLLIVSWIVGIFNIQLLAIAVMATLMMIAEHYILENHRTKSGGLPPIDL